MRMPIRTIDDLHLLSRRNFWPTAAAGTLLTFPALAAVPQAAKKGAARQEKEEEISPSEDLMQEHGVLRRILLIYDDFARVARDKPEPYAALHQAAAIIRDFIENYHEKQEEEDLFPRFEKAGKLVELVRVLRAQHEAGRRITEQILDLSAAVPKDVSQRTHLIELTRAFTRMYRPHAAREDTVLFPAFRKLLNPREMKELGERFEQREHQMFGGEGFEKEVGQIAALEKQLGINDLAKFTPAETVRKAARA